MRYKLIAPLREGTETKTRSEAWVMGGHSVMVMVEGVSGGVLLESVKPCLSNRDFIDESVAFRTALYPTVLLLFDGLSNLWRRF